MQQRLEELDQAALRRRLRPADTQSLQLIDQHGQPRINFGSNDYLGLASQPLTAPARPPGDRLPPVDQPPRRGSGASALVCGHTLLHQRLIDALRQLEETEAAVLYPSGYAACSGCVAALARRGDLILSDALNHASLIDGCRLSKAERFVFAHADTEMVEALLKHHRRSFRNAWIVTDSVFSMDGDIAPLQRLAAIAARYDATLIVDEAHGTAVLGSDGSGACAALGIKDQVPIRIGTLSKALGAQGGFVVGPQVVIDYLLNHSRPLIYSTAAAPTTIAAALLGVQSIAEEPKKREHVQRLSRRLRAGLRSLGKDQPADDSLAAGVPIVPIRLGAAEAATAAAEQLWDRGFYVPAIRPPTVPPGTSRLRVSLSAAHSEQQVDALLEAIAHLPVA
ncbi:8-amino-7-oxononanoate synthase [Roseimaritima ulvae]|uniref:8-amino-7-oxononanoate synthase n=2 Tax=Roseimaritima ulvae TaxID=980254 RepID=A0A5B9QTQ7_9BACT|nr:8-amino-7-oxononanoate synthase [Roseimaritima ulvae]